MKKITVWMLALMLVPGLLVLGACKKAETTDNAATGEPMAEATPEATPMAAEATPTPAAQ